MPQNQTFVVELREMDGEGLLGRGTLAKVS